MTLLTEKPVSSNTDSGQVPPPDAPTVDSTRRALKPDSLDPVRNNSVRLRLGSSGLAVRSCQSDLIEVAKKLGIRNNLENSDEFKSQQFGRKTYRLLCQIQSKLNLTKADGSKVELVRDGILGPRTQRAIDIALDRPVQSVTDFIAIINNDWTGYDFSSRRSKPFYDKNGFEFNENTLNPYLPSYNTNIRINQTQRWNCGPTASAMAIGPLIGVHPGQLYDFFTRLQRSRQGARGMGWNMPEEFAREVGIQCQQLGIPSINELFVRSQRGERLIISVNNQRIGRNGERLTNGGHIIALGNAYRGSNGKIYFENLDSNGRNVNQKGFRFLSEDQLRVVMKQAWSYHR